MSSEGDDSAGEDVEHQVEHSDAAGTQKDSAHAADEQQKGRYVFEFAKSGRAGCKNCKEKIAQGALRFGSSYVRNDMEMITWLHVTCIKPTMARHVGDAKNTGRPIDFDPRLTEEQTNTILSEIQRMSTASKADPYVPSEAMLVLGKTTHAPAATEAPAPKKPKLGFEDVDWASADLNKLNADALKSYLRHHTLPLSGSKAELVERVGAHLHPEPVATDPSARF